MTICGELSIGSRNMTIVAVIEECLASGEPVTLDRLGGLDQLLTEREVLLAHPYLDILVALTATAPSAAQPSLDRLLLEGFGVTTSPTTFRAAASTLLDHVGLPHRIAQDLLPILIARIEARSDASTELIAAYALETLFRLSLIGFVNRYRVLAIMTELRDAEGELFAAHAAKLVGSAFAQWGGDDLIASLEQLLGSAEAEAAYELGLVLLAGALEQQSLADVLARLEAAQLRFRQAATAGEERADAVAYEAVIDLVRGFSANRSATELQTPLDRLGVAVADRRGLLQAGSFPAWFTPRLDRETAWVMLARDARKIAQDLSRPSWLNAAAIMGQVLAVYDAERTMSGSPGLRALLRPRIEAAFIREQGLAAHLDDLLADPDTFDIDVAVAARLRAQIHQRIEQDTRSRKAEENASFPLLASVLQKMPGTDELPDAISALLETELAQHQRGQARIANPVINRLFGTLTAAVSDCADYREVIKDDYNATLRQILLFCADRQDAGRRQLGPRGDYLRNPDAKEGDLQSDLRQWLKGNLTSADIQTEVEGVATGRTDVYIGFGGHRFIAELKRHHGHVNENVATSFFGQASAYQATNVRLGFLGILELVARSGPPPTLEDCLWHASFVPDGSRVARHVVIFRVPGMLQSPSSID